jgi:hypothetical protein
MENRQNNEVAFLPRATDAPDSETAAEFLSIKPRQLLQLARQGAIPAHPLG